MNSPVGILSPSSHKIDTPTMKSRSVRLRWCSCATLHCSLMLRYWLDGDHRWWHSQHRRWSCDWRRFWGESDFWCDNSHCYCLPWIANWTRFALKAFLNIEWYLLVLFLSGEYMVLIESGFTFRRALLFNFISGCTAIAGFFIGASVAENEAARTWIFVITAGTFLYIALVDLVCSRSLP